MSYTGGAVNGAVTKIANVAVEANRLVALHTDAAQVVYPSGAGGLIYGVTMHSASAGDPVQIAKTGEYPVRVDGNTAAIAIGDELIAEGTDGFARKTTGSPTMVLGMACALSTADNDLILVDLKLQFI